MTTVQESTNGHRVSPPPCPFPDSQEENRSKDSTNNLNSTPLSPTPTTEAFPANAYHVPPSRYTPKAYPYRHDDTLDLPPETDPLPERCQFMFSDGRQCTMARSDIHPSLCHYHSEREEQLFGTPGLGGGAVVGRSFDLPELYLASADLTTAAGVNRALGQVFRLLAQRRISRQEAATFAKLGHLLLQSISAVRAECVATDNHHGGSAVILSSGESHGHQELSPVNKVQRERRISPGVPQDVNCARREQPALTNVPPSAPPTILAQSEPSPDAKNSLGMNTSADYIRRLHPQLT